MNSKRKLLISMLAIVFVLLAVVATIAIAFALTQQTITTTLNIGYVVEDIDGTASATYTIGGVTERLTAMKGDQVIGDTLVFHAGDTEDAGNLMFPEGQIPLSAQNNNIVIQYTYSNTGERHYIASMSFDSELVADNMKVEYSIDGVTYSENRYAVVVPANTSNKSYWIKISIDNKAKSASFTGDFKWLLSGCDEQADSYLSLTSVEFQGSNGSYSASLANAGSYVGELVFPSSVNGDPVTTISGINLTDEQKNQVTSVYIPDSVETIGMGAFSGYKNLQTVTFEQNETAGASVQSGTGLTRIGMDAFYGCTGLTSIELPSSVTSIGELAFAGCTGLTNITVASGNTKYHSAGNCLIETASKTLLLGCNTSVIPTDGSVTSIEYEAFSGCTGLTSVTIPSSVTSIGWCAFSVCSGLTSITVASGNTKYHSAGNCLIETASKTLVLGCKTSVIPTDGSVTSIGANAFSGCTGLTNIVIPTSVTSMGERAFYGCTGLTSITIPSGVTSIGSSTFQGCTDLTSVTIGSGVTSIGASAFYGCTGLTSIVIPDSVTSIRASAFQGCTWLTSITFANKTGWKAGTTTITEAQLSDPTTSATLLKDTYGSVAWARS